MWRSGDIASCILILSYKIEVCGQLYSPAALPQRTETRYSMERKLGGAPEPVWTIFTSVAFYCGFV
jgi:hypothetical protein